MQAGAGRCGHRVKADSRTPPGAASLLDRRPAGRDAEDGIGLFVDAGVGVGAFDGHDGS